MVSRAALVAATLVAVLACRTDAPGDAAAGAANATAPRIVSLAPALTAIVRSLGGDAHLVGVTAFCDAPGVTVVGDFKPRPEAVLAARPDRVLMAGYPTQAETASALTALGLTVDTLPLVTLDDMRRATRAIGVMIDRQAAAEASIAALEDALTEARAAASQADVSGASPPVGVLLVYDVQPGFVITSGGGDHVSELLARLGAKNLIDGPVTARIGLEKVLAADPELILHVAPDAAFPDSVAALAHWGAWPGLTAVRRREVVVFPGDGLARNGPHLAQVVPVLAKILAAARLARTAIPIDGGSH